MSAEERQQVSERMKQYWADRRKKPDRRKRVSRLTQRFLKNQSQKYCSPAPWR